MRRILKLKQKTKDHKHLDVKHRKLIVDGDQQQEKIRELRNEVCSTTDALAGERTKAVEAAKMLEEVARERMELTLQHHEETERATMALNKVQTTYQAQLIHYHGQAEVTARLIKQLKDERQAVEDKSKMGLGRIWDIVLAWRDRTKMLVEESSIQWWSKWEKQTTELHILQADAEN